LNLEIGAPGRTPIDDGSLETSRALTGAFTVNDLARATIGIKRLDIDQRSFDSIFV